MRTKVFIFPQQVFIFPQQVFIFQLGAWGSGTGGVVYFFWGGGGSQEALYLLEFRNFITYCWV